MTALEDSENTGGMNYDLNIDLALLKAQIDAVLESNMPEEEKTGLHNLLGDIFDQTVELQRESELE